MLTLVTAPLSGWISDRLGRRKPPLVLSAIISAIGIALIVTSESIVQFLIGMALSGGVATGIMFGVYIAMGVSTIKEHDNVARHLGILNIAATLPFSVVPFVAPLILGVGGGANYTLLYLVGGAISLGCIPLLLRIRASR